MPGGMSFITPLRSRPFLYYPRSAQKRQLSGLSHASFHVPISSKHPRAGLPIVQSPRRPRCCFQPGNDVSLSCGWKLRLKRSLRCPLMSDGIYEIPVTSSFVADTCIPPAALDFKSEHRGLFFLMPVSLFTQTTLALFGFPSVM